jgi:hypothetical protein
MSKQKVYLINSRVVKNGILGVCEVVIQTEGKPHGWTKPIFCEPHIAESAKAIPFLSPVAFSFTPDEVGRNVVTAVAVAK